MRSEILDSMAMDEVLKRCRIAGDNEYWVRVAKTKLREYRRDMVKLAKFIPDCDWQAKAAAWETELANIAR